MIALGRETRLNYDLNGVELHRPINESGPTIHPKKWMLPLLVENFTCAIRKREQHVAGLVTWTIEKVSCCKVFGQIADV